MARDTIIGFCRFSYVGRSDWRSLRGVDEITTEHLDKIAADLLTPQRMARRFASFEHLTLASIKAQTDPDFRFVVVTTNRLPPHMRARLEALCAPVPQVELIYSDAPGLSQVLRPVLVREREKTEGHVVQFRLDDDDALPVRYIENLRRHAARFADQDRFAISFNRGLMMALQPGRPPQPLAFELPFLGAACAFCDHRRYKMIYEVGHFALGRKMLNLQDVENPGAFVMRWESDSVQMNLDKLPSYVEALRSGPFREKLRVDYPYMQDFRFISLLHPPAL